MKHSFKSSWMFVLVVLALIVSALGTTPAFADDATPPPAATETPVATEEPVATEPPVVTEEPPATEVPVVTEEPIATEVPILTEEPAVTEEPVATEVPVADSSEEAPSVVDVLEQFPADTQIVVLDEAGSLEPLATQEAAEIVQTGDPMWCPAGVTPTPGVGGCTASFASLQALLDYLAIDANEPTQAGVIWIAADYDSSVNDAGVSGFVLDGGAAFSIMSQYDLTIQGGWSGGNNTAVDHNNLSVFNGDSLGIQNWFGNVTINDIHVMNTYPAYDTGLEVVTNGDVNVTNSTFTLDFIGLDLTSTNGSVTLNGVTTDLNHEGARVTARDDISITNSTFHHGLGRFNGALTLHSTNGGLTLDGVTVMGTWGGAYITVDGDINVMNSTFSQNLLRSFWASSTHGDIFITHSAFNDNVFTDGAYLATPGDVVVMCSEFKRNDPGPYDTMFPYLGYGLNAANVTGSLTLSSVTFEGNRPELLFGTPVTYAYNGNATINTVDCTLASEPSNPASANADGKSQALYYHVEQTEDQLPAVLGEGNSFVSAFKIILTPAGEKIRNLQIELEFPIPEDMQDDQLAVLYWDGSLWAPVPGGHVIDGYFVITVTRPGYYVLVSQ